MARPRFYHSSFCIRVSLGLLLLLPGSIFCGNGLVAVSAAAAGRRRGRSQLVSVSAPWPTSCLSPLAEASEFLAESDATGAFWDYVEALGDAPQWLFSCESSNSDTNNIGGGGSESGGGSHAIDATLAEHGQQVKEERGEAKNGHSADSGAHDDVVMIEGGAVSAAAIRAAGEGFESGGHGDGKGGLGLDELSLRLLEVALSARSHAPAIESHRTLAELTLPVCERRAPSAGAGSPGAATTPAAWVVLLPSGRVACSPDILADALSGICSAAAGGGDASGGSCLLSSPSQGTELEDKEAGAVGERGAGGRASGGPAAVIERDAPENAWASSLSFDHVYDCGGGEHGDIIRGTTATSTGDKSSSGGRGRGVSGSCDPETTAILYGTVGSPTMMEFHRVLKAAAENGAVRYVFRHALPYGGGGGSETTSLQGYGVVLDVKNMEYRNLDDSSEKEGGSDYGDDGNDIERGDDLDGALSIVEGEEVGGVVLSTLAERRPELKRELGILRQALLLEGQDGDDGGSEELKVWNMGDLGLQALQSVAGAEDPLLRLEELSQSFPSHASALSALKVQPGAREEAQVGQFHFFSELGLRHGSLYMNGKILDLEGPTFNAFQILSMLRAEASLLRELTSIGAPSGALAGNRGRSLLTAAGPVVRSESGVVGAGGPMSSRASSPGWRVDVIGPAKDAASTEGAGSPSPIVWLNDIQMDHTYKMWSPTLQQLAYQSFQLPRVRRNLCHLVVVADPTTAQGVEALKLLGMIVEQGVPVRVGVVLASQEDVDAVGDAHDESWGSALDLPAGGAATTAAAAEESPKAREIAELFSRLSEHSGRKAALSFLREVAAGQGKAFGTPKPKGNEGGGRGPFLRRDLAGIFLDLAEKKGPLSESRAVAEPWTEAGASWGTSDGDRIVMAGAWEMARLCSTKGLSVQTWSMNGAVKENLGEIRSSLMQTIMQENMLISQLFLEGLVSDKTKDIYSRVLKHSGAKVHRRIHPAFAASLADDHVVDLSSHDALALVEGEGEEREGGRGDEGDTSDTDVQLPPRLPPLDWLHPPGTSDSAKGVSMLVVVDPHSIDGLRTLEQALSVLVSSKTEGASGLRLSVVFNPSMHPSVPSGEDVEDRSVAPTMIGEVLPAAFEAVGSRSPDKVPRFLLSAAKAAADAHGSGSGSSFTADGVRDLAADAGLSPSLRTAVADAIAAAAAAAADSGEEVVGKMDGGKGRARVLEARRRRDRRTSLVRSVLSLDKGESCALVNGRRAIPARAGRALTVEDLSIAIEAAADLGSFLVQDALSWDWGSWPEGSPQSTDPDLVNAQLQSNVVFRLASFLWRYHQEPRKMIPGPDVLADGVAGSLSTSPSPEPAGRDNSNSDKSASVRSVVHLVPGDDDTGGSSSDRGSTEGVGGEGEARSGEGARERGVGDGAGAAGGTGAEAGVDVELVAVLDPLSAAAQRASTFLLLARDVLGLPITLLLTPLLEVSELPLKNFYRLVLGPSSASRASFDRLPTRDVLTQRLDTPEPWNVQASAALQDLDNLRCDSAGCGDHGTSTTSAEYTLKGLLLTGRCYDVTDGNPTPPQGLQLVLRAPPSQGTTGGGDGGAVMADTVVMSNLGYFQLQSAPGVWELALASGRASDVYEIVGAATDGDGPRGSGGGGGGGAPHRAALEVERRLRVELKGKEASPSTEAQAIVVRNFYSRYEPVLVRKRKGMEDVGLLEHEETAKDSPQDVTKGGGSVGGSIWSSVTGMMSFGGKQEGKELDEIGGGGGGEGKERVHVFSLATGHLYERLMKVMMMSVVKRCSVPVTFWLLENFLSPSFKESARALAEEFGFRVEFVTYKWPEWLRRQSEKQRIIWGYKILFLDVLFPLHVDKVIYVDADQVVRADLKELWDLDLQGAPYGYTPFCSSREETLGYQFWRGGFWKNHLMGRSYHISALYVVDLKVFRRRAVGDSLRSMYNSLSADPNSLSNLDQDLPNYAQYEVPIFSLPQEWLWCETWCSDASKANAKTIDLCNNPQHKEPKLDMAKRVISGPLFKESWVELDAEVRAAEESRQR